MSPWAALLLALAYNIGLIWPLRLDVAANGVILRRCRWFQILAVCGIVLFDGLAIRLFFSEMGHMGFSGPFLILPVCGALALSLMPFIMFIYGELFDAARKAAMSEDNIKVEKTFDQVEAALKQKDYARAETMLREAIEEDPKAPEPHRRVADVLLARGDLAGCIRELKQAAALTREAEPKAVTMFRIADLLLDKANDSEGAEAALKSVLYEFPGTQYVQMAQTRLDRLAQRARPPVG